eukprot:CAMPEP_0196657734 /NCGR_PEP_ID=MMETSP1086-20130531/25215_1 /TAXON_ID=77921 /ORGANISM="Cyanoptyche  gloeocystis , Strain SAG4.97" /LENGTH=245 /DNA_ID=CAMNT_0041990981 /DNA_START=55 /DNA_END=789 /DNA_ORIENTATION=+
MAFVCFSLSPKYEIRNATQIQGVISLHSSSLKFPVNLSTKLRRQLQATAPVFRAGRAFTAHEKQQIFSIVSHKEGHDHADHSCGGCGTPEEDMHEKFVQGAPSFVDSLQVLPKMLGRWENYCQIFDQNYHEMFHGMSMVAFSKRDDKYFIESGTIRDDGSSQVARFVGTAVADGVVEYYIEGMEEFGVHMRSVEMAPNVVINHIFHHDGSLMALETLTLYDTPEGLRRINTAQRFAMDGSFEGSW